MTSPGARFSRRGLLAGLGAGAGALTVAACDSGRAAASPAALVPFFGEHQAGIATPAQDRLVFAAFDVTSTQRSDLVSLLGTWTDAAVRMTLGQPVADDNSQPELPPQDTGEATGLPPSNLTITVGFGPRLFDSRFGLGEKRPAALADLPSFPRDSLDPAHSDGDICIQACADDPQVAFHAIRNLRRLAFGVAELRWLQLGFGRTSSTSESQATPRNLMGFKDGTNNLKAEDVAGFDDFVWVGNETDQPWMKGGSYVVTRRIRMLLEAWDRDYLADQENVIGREKSSGAPLGEKTEFTAVPLTARTGSGQPVIPANAHIRLAAPATNGGFHILRRGYSYTDGVDETGQLDAGLFFVAYQKDPRKQFVVIQNRLANSDNLNEYIEHTSSGVFACPPGLSQGQSFGHTLFA